MQKPTKITYETERKFDLVQAAYIMPVLDRERLFFSTQVAYCQNWEP